jgi:GTPase
VKADDRSFVLADIPGLIEGAHQGLGLGTKFLGHVERTSVLLHLIDATQDDVAKAYKTVRNELKAYGEGLADKPEIVALNKCDAIGPELAEEQAKALKKVLKKKQVFLISAVSGDQVQKVLHALADRIAEDKKEAAEAS